MVRAEAFAEQVTGLTRCSFRLVQAPLISEGFREVEEREAHVGVALAAGAAVDRDGFAEERFGVRGASEGGQGGAVVAEPERRARVLVAEDLAEEADRLTL